MSEEEKGDQGSGHQKAPEPAPLPPSMPPDPHEKAINTTTPPGRERRGKPGQNKPRRE